MAPISGIDVDAKLALVEFLLTSLDLQESARRAVDWLVAHAPIDQAVVIVGDRASNEFLLVAEYGVSSSAIMDFSLNREETSNPLVQALAAPGPVYIDTLPAHVRAPVDAETFHAIPLRTDDGEQSVGLLVVSGPTPELDAETLWVARAVGKQIWRRLTRQIVVETRFGQERMLLYSALNAVTDPMMGSVTAFNALYRSMRSCPNRVSTTICRVSRRQICLPTARATHSVSASSSGVGPLTTSKPTLCSPSSVRSGIAWKVSASTGARTCAGSVSM